MKMKQVFTILTIASSLLCAPVSGAERVDQANAFRDDLITTIANYQELTTLIPVNTRVLEQLDWAQDQLQTLPVEDFNLLASHIGMSIRKLRQTSDMLLDESMRQPPLLTGRSTPFPEAPYPDLNWEFSISVSTSPDPPAGGSSSASETGACTYAMSLSADARMIIQNEVLIGEAIVDTTGRICAAITPAGELLCIVPDIIFIVLRGIKDNTFMCNEMIFEAEVTGTYKRLEHVYTDISELQADITARIAALETDITTETDYNETLIVDIGADLGVHDLNMNARTDAIAAKIRALSGLVTEIREEDLRIMIEISLADTDNKQVGAFRFPQALGGELETVRATVRESLDQLQAAGQGIGNAETFLANGDAFMASGAWERAYDQFGRAYRTAAGNTGGPDASLVEADGGPASHSGRTPGRLAGSGRKTR
jgi:hypothetical protein